MRLTINLDDDLYAMARTHALLTKTSISKAVGDLLRRRVSGDEGADRSPAGPDAGFRVDPETLLPVVRGDGRKPAMADVQRAIDDDDLRIMEAAGWITPGDPSP